MGVLGAVCKLNRGVNCQLVGFWWALVQLGRVLSTLDPIFMGV